MYKRRVNNYFDETPDTIISINDLINTCLDIIEAKTEIDAGYLKKRVSLAFELLGIKELIELKSHNNKSFLQDLLDGRISLETTGLSSFQGYLEVNLDDVDVAAGYKTVIENSKEIKELEELLSNLNYSLILNYLHNLDPDIQKRSVKLKNLIDLGLPASPETNLEDW
jgi:hypothetical protein